VCACHRACFVEGADEERNALSAVESIVQRYIAALGAERWEPPFASRADRSEDADLPPNEGSPGRAVAFPSRNDTWRVGHHRGVHLLGLHPVCDQQVLPRSDGRGADHNGALSGVSLPHLERRWRRRPVKG
jgi:hypothetical protein